MRKKTNNKALVIVLAAMVAGTVLTGCEKCSDERVDLYEYLNFMDYSETETDEAGNELQSEGTKLLENQAAVIGEGEVTEYRAIVADGKPYVDIEAVQEYVDSRFYWDSVEGYVMYTNASDIYSTYVGESECYLNDYPEKLDYVVSYVEGNVCYVSMEFVDKFADVDYKLYKAEDNKPARVSISYASGEYVTLSAKKDNKMRVGADLMSDIVVDIKKEDKVTILEEGEEWSKVQTKDGFIGFVQTKHFENKKTKKVERENDYATYTHNTLDEKVKLVWHQVTNTTANGMLGSLIGGMKGVNVISPTWFTMSDKKGGISDISSADYVEKAHRNDLQVWALVDDFSANADGEKYVNTVLASTSTRKKLEDNLIRALVKCGADGINIDFEYISLANVDNYHQFLREMSIKCKKNNLIMSIDNYVPSEYSGYYDMNQQGRLADYIIVMSYDEHTASSEEAGPVASLPFVKKAVEDTVALVGDAKRVIMGVPFYTRVWDEVPEEYAEEGAEIIEDSVNGNYALSSRAVSMDTAKEIYEEAGAEPAWNEDTGTNYVYIQGERGSTMIWIEDAKSIQEKLNVALENGIGGIGCWKLGLESEDIWNIIEQY